MPVEPKMFLDASTVCTPMRKKFYGANGVRE